MGVLWVITVLLLRVPRACWWAGVNIKLIIDEVTMCGFDKVIKCMDLFVRWIGHTIGEFFRWADII